MFHAQYLVPSLSGIRIEETSLQQKLERFMNNSWLLYLCKFAICVVSALDIYLTIKYVDSLPMLELNPIGRWLMNLDQSPNCDTKQIAVFITAKFAGNYAVLVVLDRLAAWKTYMANAVGFGVASCQLILFYFLVFYDTGM